MTTPSPSSSAPSVRVFISYSSRNSAVAEALKESLQGNGISCFYAPSDIQAREIWRDRLESEIQLADLILLLYTPEASASEEVYAEIELAHNSGKDIWLLKHRQAEIAERFKKFELGARYHAFLFESGTESAFFQSLRKNIDERFGRVDLPQRGAIDPENNPYPGTPYSAKDQDLFFGRDAERNRLLSDMYDGEERIFFVYGPSGAGKTSLIDAGLRGLLQQRWWFSELISASLEEPETMPIRLWQRLLRQLTKYQAASDRLDTALVPDILAAVEAMGKPGYVFWFDHMEHLLALEDAEKTALFFRIASDLLERTRRVRIIISFRRELLAQAEDHAKLLPPGSWRKWLLRSLTSSGARDCIIRPAEKHRVRIDAGLADALVAALARSEGEDREGKKIVTVNPVGLQLVCGRLWLQGKPGLASISGADLPKTGKGLQADVEEFVKHALENRLEDAIEKIAGKAANQVQRKELIRLGLLQFVSEDHRRQQLKEETSGTGKRVGRLRGDIVDALYAERLLQRTDIGLSLPDYRYELVHDSLAEAIDRFRAKVDLLRTLNALESLLRSARHHSGDLTGCFNRNADLLADLESSRREETGFFDDEKEFLFRCALGDQRRSLTRETLPKEISLARKDISLEGWALLLADGNIETFAAVMREALSPTLCGDNSVRRDAIGLLMLPELRAGLSAAHLDELGSLVLQAALDSPEEVHQTACVALCQVRQPAGAGELFGLLKDKDQSRNARRAIGWIRHAADRREIADLAAGRAFEDHWKSTSLTDRIPILTQLWSQRTIQSFGWMAFVIILATTFTAIGAGLAFLPMGFLGAALTMGDKGAGAAKGGFHGIAGGAFWGVGIATALLLYWVTIRGGRVAPRKKDWLPAAFCACMGGFLAGVALSLVLGFVFQDQSLYHAGWIRSEEHLSAAVKIADMFRWTMHGWITPVFGWFVAAGICWSLQTITANPKVEAYLQQQPGALNRPSQAMASIRRVTRLVVKNSWRNFIAVFLGGLAVYALLHPGVGICDVTAPSWGHATDPCDVDRTLMPMPARVAGMIFIIWIGGIFLEVGFLFGILSARVGVKLERDEHFLQPFSD